LFVSHDAAAIEALCTRGIVLDQGKVVFDGTQTDAIERYASLRAAGAKSLDIRTDRTGTGQVRVNAIELRDSSHLPMAAARSGRPLEVVLHFQRRDETSIPALAVELTVSTHLGAPVFFHSSWLEGVDFDTVPEAGQFVCRFPELPLPPGHYHISYQLTTGSHRRREPIDALSDAIELHVESGDFFGSGKLPPAKSGVCLVHGTWRLEPAASPSMNANR